MDEFERRKQTPQYWCNKSSDLRASAGAVWYCIKCDDDKEIVEKLGLGTGFSMAVAAFPVFPMLCGLSLELMYKAICVAKHVKFNQDHNLLYLCQLAGVPTSAEDCKFLALYTESVIWDAKYPVPSVKRKFALDNINDLRSKLLSEEVPGTRFKTSSGVLSWDTFNSLWSKACVIFYKLKPD